MACSEIVLLSPQTIALYLRDLDEILRDNPRDFDCFTLHCFIGHVNRSTSLADGWNWETEDRL